MPNVSAINTPQWQQLKTSAAQMKYPNDFGQYKHKAVFENITVDFSRHYLNEHVLNAFSELLEKIDLNGARHAMFAGEKINTSENRSVLHTALRGSYLGDDQSIPETVSATQARFLAFADRVRNQQVTGFTGKAIQTVINLGVGGSDLGPRMIAHALSDLHATVQVKFVANIDPHELDAALVGCLPESTLFILASKSFTTMETHENVDTAKRWLAEGMPAAGEVDLLRQHFVASTQMVDQAVAMGLSEDLCFYVPDWVGGRFSLWSPVGLSIAIALGADAFLSLLAGAHAMDQHFLNAPLLENIPVMLAVLGVWYTNFFGSQTHCVVSYSERLRYFADFLQQLEMESNGKSVNKQGEMIDYPTCPVLFGGVGTMVQHSFFQLLHQGRHKVPMDIFCVAASASNSDPRPLKLWQSAQSQSDSLAFGTQALPQDIQADWQAKPSYSHFEGGRPVSLIEVSEMSPYILGQLVAMYEHKVFVQGLIWNVNSFDQWGVELGKAMFNALAK